MQLRPRNRRGQGLVELALVLPIIVVLFVGTIDMARWLETSHRINRAASEGARYGSVMDSTNTRYPSEAQIRTHILESLPEPLRAANVQINTTAVVGGQPAVSVRVTCLLACFTPGFGSGISLGSEMWFPRR